LTLIGPPGFEPGTPRFPTTGIFGVCPPWG